MSFIADKIVMDGLTYDDVLLIPAYSEVPFCNGRDGYSYGGENGDCYCS